MHLVFDEQFLNEGEFKLPWTDRGFQYGDGVFETIISTLEQVAFFDLHWDRLNRALETLHLDRPDWLDRQKTQEIILELIQKDRMEKARIKLMVWRRKGGLYTPESNSAHVLITASPFHSPDKFKAKADFCLDFHAAPSPTSYFKTLSSLHYVLAAQEMHRRELDEVILLNAESMIAECSYSNIFWIKGGHLFTPALDSGCVDGIRRRHILETLKGSKEVRQVLAPFQELLEADQIFTTNVAGVSWIRSIQDQTYNLENYQELEEEYNLLG